MAKSKMSELTRGAGMAADLWCKLEMELKERGGTGEELGFLVGDQGAALRGTVADYLIKAVAIQRNRYPVQSKHKSLTEAISAGKYDYANDYITAEHFKLEGEIVVDTELVLYHPDRNIGSEDVVKELDQVGLRPATLQELCAFGEKYPDIQREFPCVALGSVCVDAGGNRNVPYLYRWYAKRELDLDDWDVEWYPCYRFLAARKPVEQAGK